MADKIQSQLTDSGAVIGYRPDLKYSKEVNNKIEVINSNITNVESSETYTATVKSILSNLPSTVLSGLNDVLESINEAISRLSEQFIGTNYDNYNNIENFINSIGNNPTYTEAFLNYHKNDISKSAIPETIYILLKEKERVELLEETLKKLYYGDSNISQEEADKKDSELKELIAEKDTTGTGLNYLSLSYDAKLNRANSILVATLDTAVLQIEQSAFVFEDTLVTEHKELVGIAEKLFTEANSKINDRINAYEVQQSLDTMQKSLYNYYSKRDELNKYYKIVSNYSSEGSYLLSQLDKFETEVDKSLENVNKTNLGNVYYLNSLEELLLEKQYLRSLYATLSYN